MKAKPTYEELERRIEELERAESELGLAKDHLKKIFDNAQDAIFIHDLEGKILDVNDKMCRMYGLTKEEAFEVTIEDVSSSRMSKEVLLERWNKVLSDEKLLFEWEARRPKDKSLFNVEVSIQRISFQDKDIVLANVRDITERKRAEKALREREEKYRLLFNMGVNAMFLVDNTTTQILECNNKASQLFDYSSKELLSMKMVDLSTTPELTRRACRENVSKQERVYQKKDGGLLSVEVTSQHFHLADRAVHLAAIRNITDKKHAEKALRESEERFRTLMENIDAIAVQGYGPDGTTQYWNAASERLYGYSRQEAIGRNILDLIIPPEMEGAVAKEIREMAESGRPVSSGELMLMHKDGSRVPVMSHHAIVKVPGREQELFCLDVDISERKRAEAEKEKLKTQLNHAQKMESVGRLAGGVAHDFNNMLSVILGHTEMVLEDLDPATQLFADLQAVHQAAKRSATLTRQLLAFARKQTIAPKVIDLNETVEGMLKMLRRLIGEDIDLTWLPGKKLVPVKVDPSQIDQILVNLCVNSRDAIVDVGKITIESGVVSFDEAYCSVHAGVVPGDYVLLAVSDNGSGMDQDTIDHLFEPFFTTKEPGKGTGLGLASVYGAVKQNNGFIHVTSQSGQGTTFRIYLPQHQVKKPIQTDKVTAKPTPARSETILLVEDEPAILRMVTRMLRSLGYVVIAANGPSEAIRLAHEHIGAIDLLMTDVVMPEMNGRDLAGNLLTTNPHIKRLFMSGYTANVIAHHGVLDEGVHFIQKPFSSKDLGAKLHEILEGKSAALR
jgi:two-component system, cell cycle sensor histidine kinase and response regulator CckA